MTRGPYPRLAQDVLSVMRTRPTSAWRLRDLETALDRSESSVRRALERLERMGAVLPRGPRRVWTLTGAPVSILPGAEA